MRPRVIAEVPIKGQMRDEVRVLSDRAKRALVIAFTGVAEGLKTDLRQDVMSAGLGSRLAGAIRARVYDARGTLPPAAIVSARNESADAILHGQSVGGRLVPRRGRWLAFPTGFNAALGRRQAGSRGGLRVTAEQMTNPAYGAFVLPSRRNPNVALWCLPVRPAHGIAARGRTRRGRALLYVADATEVATGGRRGQQARVADLLKQGFVPMFFLARSIVVKKRLSPELHLAEWAGLFPDYLDDAFARLERSAAR